MKTPRIPARIKIKNRVVYEIVWVDSFKDPKTLGECRFDARQIALKTGQSDRETLKTLIHEILHAIDYERGIPIRHRTVYQMETAIYYILFHNDWSDR